MNDDVQRQDRADASPFTTTIRRASSQTSRIMVWGLLALPLLAGLMMLAGRVLSKDAARSVTYLLIGGFVAGYVYLLNRALKPNQQPAVVRVDARGIWTAEHWLARAADIRHACLCGPVEGSSTQGIRSPAWPWTAAITTSSGRFFLTLESRQQGEWILRRLGRPVEVLSHAELPPTTETRKWKWRGWVAMLLANGLLVAIGLSWMWLRRC